MSRISDNCPVQKTTPRQGLWWRWLRLQLRKENEEGKESEEFSSPLPLPVEPSTTQRPAGVSRLATARRSLGISVRSIVHAAIRLSKPAETVQVDENEGSELRVPFHRNVSDTQCSPESDIISKMAEGSTQRLALRQFSSNFKYLQETNDERKRSSAAFFTGVADSSRSLTGATPQCLKRDLNSDSRRTSFDTVSESAAQPPPHQSITRARSNSGKGAMSVDHLNGNNESFRQQNLSRGNSFRNNADSRRGSRQLGARGASLRSINSIASVATIKDLQEVTDPYFCDMPRAPSLRECFKSSAAIRESAGAVTNKNSTGNELELAVSTTLTESHPRFNAGELTGSPRGIFRMSAPTLNVASIVDEHAQWGNTLSVSADSSVDALGQGGYTTLQNDMAASFGAGLRMGCITAGNRRASVSCTLSAFKGASGASRRGSEGCIPTHNSIPFPSTPALTTNNMPSDDICVSESGTVTVGGWKIRESGMRRASEDLTAVPLSRDPSSAGISVNEGKVRDRARRLDFLEVGIIGSGASGNVLEALHIPTLTVVAIKVLPVYQIDKLQSIARELSVLYTNLTELSLISTALDSDNNEDKHMTLGRGKPKCLHVLALYDGLPHCVSFV